MSRLDTLLWVVLPYAAITTFVVGHVWRWRTDQIGWTTRSTQILERRWLNVGSNLFHLGILMAIGGHVLGILVPATVTEHLGVDEDRYHVISVTMGSIAGALCVAGLAVLIARRLRFPRVAKGHDALVDEAAHLRTDHAHVFVEQLRFVKLENTHGGTLVCGDLIVDRRVGFVIRRTMPRQAVAS